MGGLRTNINLLGCDETGTSIAGPFNIGATIRGYYANCCAFNVAGNNYGANCLTFGCLTGQAIARGEF